MRRCLSVFGVAALIVAAGCSGSGRPTPETWLPEWAIAMAVVPSESDLGSAPTRDVCNTILGGLREARPSVEPTPYDALDAPVDSWFEVAEAMFFECPPHEAGLEGFSEGYEELAAFEAEVDAAIAAEANT